MTIYFTTLFAALLTCYALGFRKYRATKSAMDHVDILQRYVIVPNLCVCVVNLVTVVLIRALR